MALKTYLVGGAVRDQLLGLPVRERDWVVVGSSPAEMQGLGYVCVGKDFPVFLHPKTKEEYALARKERKTAKGYHGFEMDTAPSITLEEDLLRRDLTINAMALDEHGQLIDPFHGKQDLEARLLRHVSPAFSEDPVRVLRVARFCARLAPFHFQVAEETLALMKTMTANGEIDALVPERVLLEISKTLKAAKPSIFFEVLQRCGALEKLMPGFEKALSDLIWKNALDESATESLDEAIRFAILLYGAEKNSPGTLAIFQSRYRLPRTHLDLIKLFIAHQSSLTQAPKHAEDVMHVFEKIDAFRRKERFFNLQTAIAWLTQHDKKTASIQQQWKHCLLLAEKITPQTIDSHVQGAELGKAIREKRIKAITSIL